MRGRSKAFSKAPKRHKSGSARPKGPGPAVNPSSIEVALLLWMSRPGSSECEESRKRLAVLESEIASHSAKDALEKLLAAGCDRSTLLRGLGLSCGKPVDFVVDNWFTKPGPQSLEVLFGLKGRAFSALKDLLLEAADRVDGINRRFEFGVLLTAPHLRMFQGIPRLLQGYVSLLDLAAKRLAGGAHLYRNVGKAILTLYVKQQTGGFRDEQVSALLAAVRDNDRYDAGSQRAWREEQKDLLARIAPLIPIFTSDSVRTAIENL
jgi:hypothetical protein